MAGTKPGEKPDGHRSPPEGYPSDRDSYADPTNYRYPLDTEEHVRAALSYWGRESNRSGYSSEEQAYITARIEAAARRHGIGDHPKSDTPTLQHKTFPAACVKTIDADQGIAEMFVSVFNNVDASKERVLPGFFKSSLQRKLPKGVWMHDWTAPVAKTLEAEEVMPGDERLPDEIKSLGGLRILGQFNLETQRGREAFSDLKFGTVDEFSFGYVVEQAETEKGSGVKNLIKGTMYEWSPVLVGCNPATALVGVKELEGPLAALRDFCDELMGKQGRVFSAANREQIMGHARTLHDVADKMEGMMASTDCPKGQDPDGISFSDQLDAALAAAEAVRVRGAALAAKRAEDGRSLGKERKGQIAALAAALAALSQEPEDRRSVALLKLKHRDRAARLLAAGMNP